MLDAILKRLIEDDADPADLQDEGFERDVIDKVHRLLYQAEYKRFQSPPGVKVTRKSFGRERRYPLTNGLLRTMR